MNTKGTKKGGRTTAKDTKRGKDYILRNVDEMVWRGVKAYAAVEGLTIRDLLLQLIWEKIKI